MKRLERRVSARNFIVVQDEAKLLACVISLVIISSADLLWETI